jgi:hypothetical protein
MGGIRIFYSSSILWDSDLSSIREKVLLNYSVRDFTSSDSRFSQILLPESPHARRSPATSEDSEDTHRCYLEPFVLIAFVIPATDISLWMTTYTCHSHDHSSSLLLLQDASKYSSLFRKSLELLPCSSLRMKNLTVKSSQLSRIRSSQLFLCFTKFLRNAYRSFENPLQPVALGILVCLHYG